MSPNPTLASPFLDEALDGSVSASPFEQVAPPAPSPAAAGWRFRVQDRAGRPLEGIAWALHQGGAVWQGTLDAKGETGAIGTPTVRFDVGKRFRLHVAGHACCIVSGAAIVVDEPAVEYGGQWFDWQRAADPAFWKDHDAARQAADEPGVFQFMQHDHVLRRPLRALGGSAVFEARPLAIRLGPLVRYTDDDEALVWLELQTPALVRVVYGRAVDQTLLRRGAIAPPTKRMRYGSSVRVGGRHFALVALDALQADTAYQYTVELAPPPPDGALPVEQADFSEPVFPSLLPAAALQAQQHALEGVAFSGTHWLAFRTLARESKALRFAHGSCRKWPADADETNKPPGADMLDAFGAARLEGKPWAEWPRFFVHTGDQIYADDIGVRLGQQIVRERFAAVAAGPAPRNAADVAFGAWAGRFGVRYFPHDGVLAPARADLEELRRHRLSDPNVWAIETMIAQAEKALAQDDRFADRSGPRVMRRKLRLQNRLLWEVPVEPRDVPRIDRRKGLLAAAEYRVERPSPRRLQLPYPAAGETGGVHVADFAEYAAAYEQAWGTLPTRRALAHLPSYMIFDDHEVTDDWNADAKWLEVVHSARDPLQCWPMTITDALASYWLYQGWGNLSPAAAADDSRVQILERHRRSGRDALPELRRLILDRAVRPSAKGGDRSHLLAWNFAIPAAGTAMPVLDLRTDRDVHGSGGISPERLKWLEAELVRSRSPAAFIVLPVPYLMPAPMLWAMRHPRFTGFLAGYPSTDAYKRGSDVEHPVINAVWQQIRDLLGRLQAGASALKTLAIISGDVHFSFNLDAQLSGSRRTPRLLQLVSSGLRQAISETKQGQLRSAYQGWLNTVGGSEGVDKDSDGFTITVGGMQGPGRETSNFLYPTSFAIVDLQSVPASAPGQGQVRVPLIVQTHVYSGPDGKLAERRFRHMTQPTGSAVMSLHDPGPSPRLRPSSYPAVHDGLGLVREAEEAFELQHAADETEEL